MADSLRTISGIATFIYNSFSNVPLGISGTIIQLVDVSRQNVSNYTGVSIGSNSIADEFQPAIIDFAKADILQLLLAQPGYSNITLDQLSISQGGGLSPDQYRIMAESKLKSLGRKIIHFRSLS